MGRPDAEDVLSDVTVRVLCHGVTTEPEDRATVRAPRRATGRIGRRAPGPGLCA